MQLRSRDWGRDWGRSMPREWGRMKPLRMREKRAERVRATELREWGWSRDNEGERSCCCVENEAARFLLQWKEPFRMKTELLHSCSENRAVAMKGERNITCVCLAWCTYEEPLCAYLWEYRYCKIFCLIHSINHLIIFYPPLYTYLHLDANCFFIQFTQLRFSFCFPSKKFWKMIYRKLLGHLQFNCPIETISAYKFHCPDRMFLRVRLYFKTRTFSKVFNNL